MGERPRLGIALAIECGEKVVGLRLYHENAAGLLSVVRRFDKTKPPEAPTVGLIWRWAKGFGFKIRPALEIPCSLMCPLPGLMCLGASFRSLRPRGQQRRLSEQPSPL